MVSREETFSYEALERELEYLKRMKMTLLQHPVGSGLLHTPSQELPLKPTLTGKKRKSACGEPHEPVPKGSHGPSLLPELQDRQAPPQLLQVRQPSLQLPLDCQPSMHPSQYHKPSPQWSKDGQPWTQMQPLLHHLQDQQPLQRQSQGQEPLQQQPLIQQPPEVQAAPIWCNLCKLNCVTHHNLKIHMQGKKHKAKWGAQSLQVEDKAKCDELSLQVEDKSKCDELSLQVYSHNQQPPQIETNLAWCSLCKLNCKNPQNLKRHLQGRKHKAKWDKQSLQVGHKAKLDELYLQPLQIQTAPVWCTLCKLNCMNPQNLKRHLQGKKHKAKWNEQPLQAYHPRDQQLPEIQAAPVWCKSLQIGLHEPS